MRNIVLALMIAALATPAFAQMGDMGGVGPNISADAVHMKTDVEVKQEQEREAGYKSGLGKIPDAKVKKDPWGNVRSGSTSNAKTSHK